MNEQYGVLTTEITAPSNVGLKSYIYDLSDSCEVQLEVIYEDKGYTQGYTHDTMRIKVTGPDSHLNVFQNELEDTLAIWQKDSFTSEHYNVNDLSIKSFPNDSLIVEVEAHRFSGIKDFATKMYNHFNIQMGAEEKTNLLNKQVKIQVFGNQKQLEQFKSVFLTYVHSKNPVKMHNVDLDGNPVENAPKNKQFRF